VRSAALILYLVSTIIITHLRLEQRLWIYDVLVKTMTACQSKDYLSKSRLLVNDCLSKLRLLVNDYLSKSRVLVRGHFVRGKATCQWLLAQVMAACPRQGCWSKARLLVQVKAACPSDGCLSK
jgi:hypothetical protein